jgi:hypothetical protein
VDVDRPLLIWDPAGTSSVAGDRVVSLTGFAKASASGVYTDVSTSAVVSVSGRTNALSARWSQVSSCVPSGSSWQSNDAVSVVWTSSWVAYGPAPIALNPEYFDELKAAICTLRWLALPSGIDIVSTNRLHSGAYHSVWSATNATPDGAAADLTAKLGAGNLTSYPPVRHETPGDQTTPSMKLWCSYVPTVYSWSLSDGDWAGDPRRAFAVAPDSWTNMSAVVLASAQTYMLSDTNLVAVPGTFSTFYNSLDGRFQVAVGGCSEVVSNRFLCGPAWGDDFAAPTGHGTGDCGYAESYHITVHPWMYFDLTPALTDK